jgi:hypothetical protein
MYRFFFIAATGLLVAVGCNQSDTVPVTGTLTLNGQPVGDAEVMFNPAPDKPGRMISAHTDSNGHFTLETARPGDGAAPGEYVITLGEYYPPGKAPAMPKGGGLLPSRFPPKYGDPAQSPLKATIERGKKNEFNFEVAKP